MTTLNAKPNTSTKRQHQTLVIAGRRRGLDLAEIRKAVGGSIRRLSAAQASDWIKRFSGRDLPNEPSQKPGPYVGKAKTGGAFRIIHEDHVDQIYRLGMEYFSYDAGAFVPWLTKNFHLGFRQCMSRSDAMALIRTLGTAKRAGEVLRVLKDMLGRKPAPNRARKEATTP